MTKKQTADKIANAIDALYSMDMDAHCRRDALVSIIEGVLYGIPAPINIPYWVQLAIDGNKIRAIKALRDSVVEPIGYNTYDQWGNTSYHTQKMGLRNAKDIVESFVP